MNNTNASQIPTNQPQTVPPISAPPTESKPAEFWAVFLLGLLLGVFGAHRFYAKKFKTAVLQLVTFGGCGIWSLIDVVTILLSKFKNSSGVVYRNPKPMVSWGIFAAVCILGFVSGASQPSSISNSGSHSSSSQSGSPHKKSDRQLIKEYVTSHYDKIQSVDIDPYTDGSYQVKIYQNSGYGYKTATYKAGVDYSAQRITSWDYVGE